MQARYQYLLLSNTGAASSYKVWLEASNGSVLPLSSGRLGEGTRKKISINLGPDSIIAGGRASLFVATSNPSVAALLKVAAPLSRARGAFRPHALQLTPARTQPSLLGFSVPRRKHASYRATLSIVSRGALPQEYTYEIFKDSKSLGQRSLETGARADVVPVTPQSMPSSPTTVAAFQSREDSTQHAVAEPFTTIDLPLEGPGSYRVKLTVRSHEPEPFSASVLLRRVY
jgi:hypothetical protein